MALLGVDYGRKRIGLALYTGGVVIPIKPFLNGNWKVLAKHLEKLTCEFSIEKIILGLPLSASGKDTELTKEVRKFTLYLQTEGFIVELVNESGTTRESEILLPGKRRNGKKDSLSACFILKRYLSIP